MGFGPWGEHLGKEGVEFQSKLLVLGGFFRITYRILYFIHVTVNPKP